MRSHELEQEPSSGTYPLGGHGHELAYKLLYPACGFQALDAFGNLADKVKVEVLHHRGHDEENLVLAQAGERHVRLAEVVVLHVEVALDRTALVVEADYIDGFHVEVVGDDGAVDELCAEQVRLSVAVPLRPLHNKAKRDALDDVVHGKARDLEAFAVAFGRHPFGALAVHGASLFVCICPDVETAAALHHGIDSLFGIRTCIGPEDKTVAGKLALQVVEHALQCLVLRQPYRCVAVAILHVYDRPADGRDAGEHSEESLVAELRVLAFRLDELVVEIDNDVAECVDKPGHTCTLCEQSIQLAVPIEPVAMSALRLHVTIADGKVLQRPADDVRTWHAFTAGPEFPQGLHVLQAVSAGKINRHERPENLRVGEAGAAYAALSEVLVDALQESAAGKCVENEYEAAEGVEIVVLGYYIDYCLFCLFCFFRQSSI